MAEPTYAAATGKFKEADNARKAVLTLMARPDYPALVSRVPEYDRVTLFEYEALNKLESDYERVKAQFKEQPRDRDGYGVWVNTAEDFRARYARMGLALLDAANSAVAEIEQKAVEQAVVSTGTPVTMDYVTTVPSASSTPSVSTGTPTQRRPQQQTDKKRGMPSLSKPSVKKTTVQKSDNTPLLIGGIAIVVLAALFFAFRSKE